ncbi:YggS family pyridoxal phosphate-dependent enzyme [Luteococcus sp. Sow4_B9]|uniref:YggS family pyridoxal phosphate-dependent enzyme n=1 Tax=Luteococcus sp. Sow4_B9 TaxID=3438792 RepID=UPI003F9CC674
MSSTVDPTPTSTLAERLAAVEERIARACVASGRSPQEVRLLPVSKTHSIEMVREVASHGYTLFGENKVQEVQQKAAQRTEGDGFGFSVIGHLQTNKAKVVAELADEFQCVDSAKIAIALDKRLQALGRRLPVLVQVNTSGEPQKSGVAPDEVLGLVREIEACDALDVRGLMTVAIKGEDAQVAACFNRMLELQRDLRDAQALGSAWDELSMGMSGDLELAVAHGSTCLRVGTAIFGARDYGPAA